MATERLPYGSGKKDVFHAFLVKNAKFDGQEEIPCIETTEIIPQNIITFSEAISSQKYDSFVAFYENDERIEAFWKNPKRYLPILKQFQGVITPDYSLYYDMPYAMQIWNTYRGKALGYWLNNNGVPVIPNVRWGDSRTFDLACLGVQQNKTIAVGTHGCIKSKNDKQLFIDGFDYIVQKLQPRTVIVYGRMPSKVFCLAKLYGIAIIGFESNFAISRKEVG